MERLMRVWCLLWLGLAAARGGVTIGSTNHWSLMPLTAPGQPKSSNPGWACTPVDPFILAKLDEHSLAPSPEADKPTLLRRVYFDLIGLPPTPEEMAAFRADARPNAYERAVDRLLESPHYGERWARHWMDIVHFAETHGHDQDRIRTNAWPYRDYLVNSFNADKPYARFVEEQLAGDVLYPGDPQATIALGFIAAGPWDESSLRDIREDTLDRQIARYIDRDDMVASTMGTFASATVHCARCHNHKFDPISQQDYYSLQAVFAGVDRAERVYDPEPAVHEKRQGLLKEKRALERNDSRLLGELQGTEMQAEVARWEKSLTTREAKWTVLAAAELKSENGCLLTNLADGSVLSGGPRPEKDTYTVTASAELANVTALRLELLTDDSLSKKGPGRQDNGNLHLSEFKVFHAEGTQSANEFLELQNPTADFNQDGWTIAHALDGNTATAWGIYPQVGKAHRAVFELKHPLHCGSQEKLIFSLAQLHGGGHLIGRFRLSVTDAPLPVRASGFPEEISSILAKPSEIRGVDEKQTLGAFYLREKIERELAALPSPHLVYAGASDFAPNGSQVPAKEPRPIFVLRRGEVTKPEEPASPGTLSCIPWLPSRFQLPNLKEEGARRAALARWLTHRDNPLTWRSIVNRVWQYHFGRGIVETPNDFGKMGAQPSHPELLDWLALNFRDSGGSFKKLDKLIVTSAVYKQSCRNNSEFAKVDSDNHFLWRMNRSRLDAESVRDAMLQIAGDMNWKMGGPSYQNFGLAPGIHVTPKVDYSQASLGNPETKRRSIYRFLFRTLPDPFMDALDCPEGSQFAPVRSVSMTPLQALALLNDQLLVSESEAFARRLRGISSDPREQMQLACELCWARKPTHEELADFTSYVGHNGLENFCRVLFNSNEFVFVN